VLGRGRVQEQRSIPHKQESSSGVLAQEERLGRLELTLVVSKDSQY